MSTMMSWHPLLPGEKPGDPELGGWRPLRPTILCSRVASGRIKTLNLFTCIQQLGQVIARRNLESAIRYVATMVSIRNRVTA